MQRYLELYYLHMLKPVLMIITFYLDLQYLIYSTYPNYFFRTLYIITFSLKPIFFTTLFIGFLINTKIKKISEILAFFIIIITIYFGFPIKEYSDIFQINCLNEFFEGKQYNQKEYIIHHFIVNLIVENLPVLLFVIINNQVMEKFNITMNGPIVINSSFFLINAFIIGLLPFS